MKQKILFRFLPGRRSSLKIMLSVIFLMIFNFNNKTIAQPGTARYTISEQGNPSTLLSGTTVNLKFTVTKNSGTSSLINFVQVFLSKNGTFDPGDIFLGYKDLPMLQRLGSVSSTMDIHVINGLTPGYYTLFFLYYNAGLPSPYTFNYKAKTQKNVFYGDGRQDLCIQNLSVSPEPLAGHPMDINCTISNIGDIASKSSSIKFYLSEINGYNPNAILLGSKSFSILNPGQTTNIKISVTPTGSLQAKDYYIYAEIIIPPGVTEKSTANNKKTHKFFLGFNNFIDLVITKADAFISSNAELTASCEIANLGSIPVNKNYYLYCWIIPGINQSRELIESRLISNASQTNTITISKALNPNYQWRSDFVIQFVVDASGIIIENNESNNYYSTPLKGPDISLSNFICPTNIEPGNSFNVSFKIKNKAPKPTNSFYVTLYYSNDNKVDANDNKLGTFLMQQLGPLSEVNYTKTILLPDNYKSDIGKQKFILVKTGTLYGEFNTSDNMASKSVLVTGHNLSFHSFNAIQRKDNIQGNLKIINTTTLSYSCPTSNLKLYLSKKSYLDGTEKMIQNIRIPKLANGALHSVDINIDIPSEYFSEQQIYLIGKLDTENSVNETNENNNILSTMIPLVFPDLTPISITIPDAIGISKTFQVSGVIKNIGDANSDPCTASIILSRDAVLGNENDINLGSVSVPLLNIQASCPVSKIVTLDDYNTIDEQYVFIVVDKNDVINERSELNNSVKKSFQTLPDIKLKSFKSGYSTYTGFDIWGDLYYIYGLYNKQSVEIDVYWSTDDRLSNNDNYLARIYATASLQNLSYDDDICSYIINSGYLILSLDPDNEIEEVDESNNINVFNFNSKGTMQTSENKSIIEASQADIRMFPNPTTNTLNIQYNDTDIEDCIISIINTKGSVVFTKSIQNSSVIDEKIDFSNYPKGIYIVKLIKGDKQFIKQVVKE